MIFESLIARFQLLMRKRNKDSIPLLEVLFVLSKIKYFAPLRIFVDQSAYGNESRYVRFSANQPTTYLKAVGIGGGVRL